MTLFYSIVCPISGTDTGFFEKILTSSSIYYKIGDNMEEINMKTKRICMIGIFAALMAVCAWITIPGPVPFTLQTFAVFLAILSLGGRDGFISILVYILLGAVGLPVFSGFRGGVGVLLASTGGYLVGFLLAALLMMLFEKKGLTARILSAAGAMVTYFAFGTAWYAVVYTAGGKAFSLTAVLMACVVPFVLPDILKIALAFVIAKRIKPVV